MAFNEENDKISIKRESFVLQVSSVGHPLKILLDGELISIGEEAFFCKPSKHNNLHMDLNFYNNQTSVTTYLHVLKRYRACVHHRAISDPRDVRILIVLWYGRSTVGASLLIFPPTVFIGFIKCLNLFSVHPLKNVKLCSGSY